MNYTVRNATIDDVKKITENSTELGKYDESVVGDSIEKRVFLYNDEPIAVLGLIEYPNGEYENIVGVWGVFSKDIEKHTTPVVRFMKDLIFDRAYYKFIVYVQEDNDKFKRFVEFFGFKPTKTVEILNEIKYRYYIKVS